MVNFVSFVLFPSNHRTAFHHQCNHGGYQNAPNSMLNAYFFNCIDTLVHHFDTVALAKYSGQNRAKLNQSMERDSKRQQMFFFISTILMVPLDPRAIARNFCFFFALTVFTSLSEQ